MKVLINLTLCLLTINNLYSQVEVEYHIEPPNTGLKEIAIVEDIPYFTANFYNAINPRNETEIWSFDDMRFREELVISTINDSLDHVYLFDFWAEGEEVYLFGYCSHKFTGDNYVYYSRVDMSSGEFYDLTLVPFERYDLSLGHLYGAEYAQVNGGREWILRESDEFNSNTIALHRFTFKESSMRWDRFEFPSELESFQLRDVYYAPDEDLLIITTTQNQRHFHVFDLGFNHVYSHDPVSLFEGISTRPPETKIIGNNGTNFQILERRYEEGQFIIHQREMVLGDSEISISEDFESFNNEFDDPYVFTKNQRDDYTMVYYSKSNINDFNEDYGFNIYFLNYEGELIKKFSIEENEPLALDVLLIVSTQPTPSFPV